MTAPMPIFVKVIPKSGRSELKFVGKSLKAWVKSAPEDGKANDELIRMLAEKFECARADVKILRGHTQKNKLVDICGKTVDEIKKAAG